MVLLVELLSACGMVFQQLTRFELWSVLLGESIHQGHVVAHTILVKITERSATEGCKARAEHKANVAHNWIGNDLIFKTLGSFVDKPETCTEKRHHAMR